MRNLFTMATSSVPDPEIGDVEAVAISQTLIGKQISDYIEIVCNTEAGTNPAGSNCLESLLHLVCLLSWQCVKANPLAPTKQFRSEVQWETACVQAKEIVTNLPLATYFRENLFIFFEDETWPSGFKEYMDEKLFEKEPTNDFLKSYIVEADTNGPRGNASRKRKSQASDSTSEVLYSQPMESIQVLFVGKTIDDITAKIVGEINNHFNPYHRDIPSGHQIGLILEEVIIHSTYKFYGIFDFLFVL